MVPHESDAGGEGMTKTATIKKLRCPASIKAKTTPHDLAPCWFEIDLTKTEELKANRDLLIHISKTHNFYWKRHGKQLVLRHNKRVAMRK